MSANFTPTFTNYSNQGAFRYWCQTVLPLVYDDSLSYYELLNKMVIYLNNTISDVSAVEGNVDSLLSAYNQLQEYVNNYLDGLDMAAYTDEALDRMAADGSLDRLLAPLVGEHVIPLTRSMLPGLVQEEVEYQIGAVVADQIDEVVGEQIGTAVTPAVSDWLEDNVTPVGSAVVVDTSMKVARAAADSKAVGENIAAICSYQLPVAYRAVEYLESHGTEYIDTGLTPSNNSRIVCEFRRTMSGQQRMTGARRSSTSRAFSFSIDENGYYLANYGALLYTLDAKDDYKLTVLDFNKNAVYLNGVLAYTFNAETFTAPTTLTVFAIHSSTGSATHWFGGFRIYSFKVYNNDTLVGNFVPCVRIADGVPGMYDTVTDTFKTNGGTGDLVAGPNVSLHDNLIKTVSTSDRDSVIADVELSGISLREYAKGDYFILGDAIFEVIAPIAVGDSITPGVNVRKTTVAEKLKSFKVRTGEFERFTVQTNIAWPNVESTSVTDQEPVDNRDILCILTLPENYSPAPSDKPTPLILYGHPMTSRITESTWYGNNDSFLAMIRAFTSAGYAVFDVNNTRDRQGGFYDWGSLPLMTAYVRAWNYIKENYNVEDKLYILSASMGTNVALNMMKWYGANVVTAVMTAPRPLLQTRYVGYTSDTDKKIMAAAYGLISDSDIENPTVLPPAVGSFGLKFHGFEQVENLMNINETYYSFEKFPPVKVLVGGLDTDYYEETLRYYMSLNRSGNYVNYRVVSGANHADMVLLQRGDLREEAIRWFDRFRYSEA